MATFVVETYLSAAGRAVRYLRSIFIPDEEIGLLLFEADSADVVATLAERAGVDPDRVALTDGRDR